MTQTRWYTCGARQAQAGKPCLFPSACKEDWQRRQWMNGYISVDSAKASA